MYTSTDMELFGAKKLIAQVCVCVRVCVCVVSVHTMRVCVCVVYVHTIR
jgi:hypothetical protein